MRALIVDDEEDIGLLLTKFLQKEGLETCYAPKLSVAQEYMSTHQFEIYFLDINLPDGIGLDLLPEIAARNKNSKVVVISAFEDIAEKIIEERSNVDICIKKPFTKSQILESLYI